MIELFAVQVQPFIREMYTTTGELVADIQIHRDERLCVLGEWGRSGVKGAKARILNIPDSPIDCKLNELLKERGLTELREPELISLLKNLPILEPQLVDGAAPFLFTAPHGVYTLRRKGEESEVHVPEDHVSFLCREFARLSNGKALVWPEDEHRRSKVTRKPHPASIDPNYVYPDEVEKAPWKKALLSIVDSSPILFAFDIHGCKNKDVEGVPLALEIGTYAMGDKAKKVGEHLKILLEKGLGSDWSILLNDSFSGGGSSNFMTSSCQVMQISDRTSSKTITVQLELSRKFRHRLLFSYSFRSHFVELLKKMEDC
jgi:hypothetical protein